MGWVPKHSKMSLHFRNNIWLDVIYLHGSEASREVANLTETENPHTTAQSVKEFVCLFVSPRGLRSPACLERDETRRDWRAIPELAGKRKDYFSLVPLLEKIREINIGAVFGVRFLLPSVFGL